MSILFNPDPNQPVPEIGPRMPPGMPLPSEDSDNRPWRRGPFRPPTRRGPGRSPERPPKPEPEKPPVLN